MITPFVAKFLRHVAKGGDKGVAGDSALGHCVLTKRKEGVANMYTQGIGMVASMWTRRLQQRGFVFAWDDEYCATHVRITKAGLQALKEYDDGQAQQTQG